METGTQGKEKRSHWLKKALSGVCSTGRKGEQESGGDFLIAEIREPGQIRARKKPEIRVARMEELMDKQKLRSLLDGERHLD